MFSPLELLSFQGGLSKLYCLPLLMILQRPMDAINLPCCWD